MNERHTLQHSSQPSIDRRPPLVWYGPWYLDGHNNVRYEALLPRLPSVQALRQPRLYAHWARALRGRLDERLLWRAWYPRQVRHLAGRYKALFCTNPRQIVHFPGPVLVDVDDPIFTPAYVDQLNRPNVVAVVTTSEPLRASLVGAGLTSPSYVIPSGVFLSQATEAGAARVRERLRKRPDDVVVGFAVPRLFTDRDRQARVGESQLRSITFLAEVMSRVWQTMPSIQLWLMGAPSRSVREYAATHPQVRLLGYVPHADVLDHFANLDVAVYPRLVGFGGRHSIKLVESMAAGAPVVSTPVAEAFHVTESGAGVLAEGPEAFAQALLRLARDPALRRSLADRGRHYAARFDWDTLAAQYEREVLQQALARISQAVPG